MKKETIVSIIFDITPDVRIRIINDDDFKAIKENKREYPFELFNTIKITIKTSKRIFSFDIPKGYIYNGSDIPRIFWLFIGSRTDNQFLIGALLHDYLLDESVHIINKHIKEKISITDYIRLSSLIYREKIKKQGTSIIKANIMGGAIHIFQLLCRYKKWIKRFSEVEY